MNKLIAVAYPNKNRAQEVLDEMRNLEKNYYLTLNDAVIAVRRDDGKVKLNQSVNLVGTGALQGAFWGSLIGLLFAGPLGWIIVGAGGSAFGALAGKFSDYGIDDNFMKELGENLKPGSSALFLLIRNMTEDKVLDEIEGTGGKVIQTNLSKEAEEKLKETLREEETVDSQD